MATASAAVVAIAVDRIVVVGVEFAGSQDVWKRFGAKLRRDDGRRNRFPIILVVVVVVVVVVVLFVVFVVFFIRAHTAQLVQGKLVPCLNCEREAAEQMEIHQLQQRQYRRRTTAAAAAAAAAGYVPLHQGVEQQDHGAANLEQLWMHQVEEFGGRALLLTIPPVVDRRSGF